jgi:hypothetical protein
VAYSQDTPLIVPRVENVPGPEPEFSTTLEDRILALEEKLKRANEDIEKHRDIIRTPAQPGTT